MLALNSMAYSQDVLQPGVYVEKQPHIYTSNQVVTIFDDGTLTHEYTYSPSGMKFNEYCRSRKYGVIVREDMESISYKNTHVELTQEYESIDGCIKDIEYELLIISGEQSWLYGDGLYGIIEKDYIIKKD